MLYCLGQVHDEQTERARELADLWRDATDATTVAGWMRKLADDRPDVIFYPEIGMDAMTYGLASRRLAPLQVASWGHPITSGLPTIDLYFSGQLLEAPLADTHYREELVRLPGTGCCTVPIEWQPQPLGDMAILLASRPGVRYVIAQTPFKIDPQDDALFPAIAATVGECTFILFAQEQFAWATDRMVERMGRAFRERDLDPQRYLLVLPWLPQEKFLALLDAADIYLDCPSFSGYTTAWTAVQHGLPIVTQEGPFMRQRLAAGLLRKIGLTETIAASRTEYIDTAIRLAQECRDTERRLARRNQVRQASVQADHDIETVRAFEAKVLEALNRQRAAIHK